LADVFFGDLLAVAVAQHGFQHQRIDTGRRSIFTPRALPSWGSE
jgi:hypothetical protein